MSSGIRIWGAAGNLQLDENSFTVRVVYSALVTSIGQADRSLFIPIAGVKPSTHAGVCLPNAAWSNSNGSQSPQTSQYDAEIVDGGVRVWFGNRNQPTGRIGNSTQRVLVFKYR
ncbi:hypothetical protein [Pseudomonas sp. AP19]|uniref:hypothetical protein n=1 Tax=Pseudomonas TaxID=286 RepID=UPI0009F1B614|nr:hypothetical protein [Pseudomonas sp. AP19]